MESHFSYRIYCRGGFFSYQLSVISYQREWFDLLLLIELARSAPTFIGVGAGFSVISYQREWFDLLLLIELARSAPTFIGVGAVFFSYHIKYA
ncbi:hypothetical protein [Dapis sp. BLCC M172]|uniref:hypothetical protein n=1 Tax=Dapis sp. BLCC M172 TaxID=2975281 RepID=UPI003CF39163